MAFDMLLEGLRNHREDRVWSSLVNFGSEKFVIYQNKWRYNKQLSIRLLPRLSIQEMVVTVVWLAGSQLRIEPSSDVAANMYALFSKWGQDWWILALLLLLFFFAFLWTETKSRSTKTQKRERRISSRLGRISFVNKGFIKWPKREFFHAGSSRESRAYPLWKPIRTEDSLHLVRLRILRYNKWH